MISIRYALRQLRCSPSFSLILILTVARSAATNTGIFTPVDGVLLKSLPIADSKTLFRVAGSPDCSEFEQLAATRSYDDGKDAVRRGSESARVLPDDFASGDCLTTLGIALDDMNGLTRLAGQQSQTVDLRFFGGLPIEETAALLDLSPATIKRHWATARVWLHREMRGESHP